MLFVNVGYWDPGTEIKELMKENSQLKSDIEVVKSRLAVLEGK